MVDVPCMLARSGEENATAGGTWTGSSPSAAPAPCLVGDALSDEACVSVSSYSRLSVVAQADMISSIPRAYCSLSWWAAEDWGPWSASRLVGQQHATTLADGIDEPSGAGTRARHVALFILPTNPGTQSPLECLSSSGATTLRPGYQRCLRMLGAGRFEVLVAEGLDRFMGTNELARHSTTFANR